MGSSYLELLPSNGGVEICSHSFDCNNFYASCERVFQPELRTKPIIILSNNDGCAIARSREAKDLVIKMGVSYYQIEDLNNEVKN